jgi:hypothetical protein
LRNDDNNNLKLKCMKKIKNLLVFCVLFIETMTGFAQSGTAGPLTWSLDNGTLTISGIGAMPDYNMGTAPWDSNSTSITNVVIEYGVTTIGLNAFSSCQALTSVTIPNSVTIIDGGAFRACWELSTITIPSSVISIDGNPFWFCFALTSINVDNANTAYSSENGVLYSKNKTVLVAYPAGKTGAFSIPSSVTGISSFAFSGSNNLTSVDIPNSVTNIDRSAFSNCSNLTSIIVDNANTTYSSENGVLYNKNKTVLVEYPEGKTGAFTIPNSVTSINSYAFIDSYRLTSVSIPGSVTGIGEGTFAYCNNLTSVEVEWDTPLAINANVFNQVTLANVTLHVPAGTKALYEAADVWKDFGKIVEPVTPQWSVDYQSFSETMTFTSVVVLDDVELQSERIEIGAFSGNECRGSVVVKHFPASTAHPYLGFLTVHGNGDETIKFRVYNHDTDTEYAATNAPIPFTLDAIYGSPAEPYRITIITPPREQKIALAEGWSWISVNVSDENQSLIEQFKSNIGDAGVLLKGRTAFIQSPGWIGSLSEITNEAMYKVNTTAAEILSFTGDLVNPALVPISLLKGWNWIGYTSSGALPVSEALANLSPQVGDQIKSQLDYSEYDGQVWVGTLETMSPGNGYMYSSNNATTQTFVYPSSAQWAPAMMRSAYEETTAPQWTANAYRYPNTMTVTSVVVRDNVELQSDNIEIGAFSGDQCRGSVLLKNFPQLTNHSYLGFLVIHGDESEEIQLRVYDHASGQEYGVANVLPFVADAIHGSPLEPYRIVSSVTGINSVQANAANVWLEQAGSDLQIHRPWNKIDNLEITDLSGRVVLREAGFTAKSINVSSLANSVYILKLTKDGQSCVKKFIKKLGKWTKSRLECVIIH